VHALDRAIVFQLSKKQGFTLKSEGLKILITWVEFNDDCAKALERDKTK
jgi:hypothetical protein